MFDWLTSLIGDVRQMMLNTLDAFLEFFKIETLAPIFFDSVAYILTFISGLGGESFSNSIDAAFTGYAEPFLVTGLSVGAYYIDWFIPWSYFSSVISFSMAAVAAALSVRGCMWLYLKVWGSN